MSEAADWHCIPPENSLDTGEQAVLISALVRRARLRATPHTEPVISMAPSGLCFVHNTRRLGGEAQEPPPGILRRPQKFFSSVGPMTTDVIPPLIN
jgi:hypothetical protein